MAPCHLSGSCWPTVFVRSIWIGMLGNHHWTPINDLITVNVHRLIHTAFHSYHHNTVFPSWCSNHWSPKLGMIQQRSTGAASCLPGVKSENERVTPIPDEHWNDLQSGFIVWACLSASKVSPRTDRSQRHWLRGSCIPVGWKPSEITYSLKISLKSWRPGHHVHLIEAALRADVDGNFIGKFLIVKGNIFEPVPTHQGCW